MTRNWHRSIETVIIEFWDDRHVLTYRVAQNSMNLFQVNVEKAWSGAGVGYHLSLLYDERFIFGFNASDFRAVTCIPYGRPQEDGPSFFSYRNDVPC